MIEKNNKYNINTPLDEFHQSYVTGRTGKVTDVLIDCIGIVVGAVLVIVVQKILSSRRKGK